MKSKEQIEAKIEQLLIEAKIEQLHNILGKEDYTMIAMTDHHQSQIKLLEWILEK
jgi:hypothetical protein